MKSAELRLQSCYFLAGIQVCALSVCDTDAASLNRPSLDLQQS